MKKIIAFLASTLIAVSMMTSLNNEAIQAVMTVKSYAANSYEGKCGDNAAYKFDHNTGTLTVSGTGSIYDNYISDPGNELQSNSQPVPWEEWKNLIKSVVIENGITHIGDFSFSDCKSLNSVKLGNGVNDIGRNAFEGCTTLSNVDFSNSVKKIGGWAFMDCTALEEINLPSSVETIDRDAFFDTGITELVIPDTVKEIYRDAFADCDNLKSVKFPKHMEVLNRGLVAGCENLTKVVFPENVKTIGRELFSGCTSLTSISIPDTVTEIDFSAFEGCANLNNIEIPKSVKFIGEAAFYDTGYYNNQDNWNNEALYLGDCLIRIKESVTGDYSVKDGTRVIASKAFYESSVHSITVPASVKNIGIIPFANCSKLNDVYFLGQKLDFISESFIDEDATYTVFCFKDSDVYKYVTSNSITYKLLDESANSKDNEGSASKSSAAELPTEGKTDTAEKKAAITDSTKTIVCCVVAVSVVAIVVIVLVLKKRSKTTK